MKEMQMQFLEETQTLLKINDLYLNFGVYQGLVQVLDGISFEMKKGEILGLVGETGCGKSVTARSITQLLEANAIIEKGEITFLENPNLLELSEKEMEMVRGKKISMIFQEPMTSLHPTMQIGDQVGEGLLIHFRDDMIKKAISDLEDKTAVLSGLYKTLLMKEIDNPNSILLKIASRIPYIKKYKKFPKLAARDESIEILRSVEMPSPDKIALMYSHELSGGMRQRVLIAIALSSKPILIVADEPTTAVDVTTQAKILNLLLKLRTDMNSSILVITHNLGVISEICDRVCVMYAGQIAEIGSVIDVFKHPLHPYTIGLMGAIHHIGEDKDPDEIKGNVPILLNPPSGCRFYPRCPRVMDICSKKKPELRPNHLGHFVHCWQYQLEEIKNG
jgi:peptide/nickel transport system ATP-binding protein